MQLYATVRKEDWPPWRIARLNRQLSGAEGNRTPVQTYSPKAFYMLISLLFVGDQQEMNKPIDRLAGWS